MKKLAIAFAGLAALLGYQNSEAFVSVGSDASGRASFIINGSPFRFVGANINELPWDDGSIDRELDYARAHGLWVVRVWGVDSSMGAPTMSARLRTVLDKAQARGLYVVIALTHNYRQGNWTWNAVRGRGDLDPDTFHAVPNDAFWNDFSANGNGFYTRPYNGLWLLNDQWISWGYRAYYKPYAEALVASLRDHPALFAWDIANETAGSSADRAIVDLVVNFYKDMAATVKFHDPNHLVTTGLISTKWAGMTQVQRDAVYFDRNIDYVTVHQYEGGPNNDSLNDQRQDDDIYFANRYWKKPVVVEEYAAAQSTVEQTKSTITNYFSARFTPNNVLYKVDGIMYWGVSTHLADRDWFIPYSQWLAGFFDTWSARLGAPAAPPAPGCGRLNPGQHLGNGATLQSCNRRYVLAMQTDGNLVEYVAGTPNAVWNSGTYGRGASTLVMQSSDGNLVVYSSSGASWWSNSCGYSATPGATLYVQDDGNLVVRAPNGTVRWSSRTGCHR